MVKDSKRDNNNINIDKRSLILSLVLVASLSVFLVASGPLTSSFISSPIKQVRAQQQPSSRPQQPSSVPSSSSQQPSSQPQQPSSQSQQPSSQSQQPSSKSQQPSS